MRRKKSFRKLFHTEIYNDIVEELNNRRKETEKSISDIKTRCMSEVGHIHVGEEHENLVFLIEAIQRGEISYLNELVDELESYCQVLEETLNKEKDALSKTNVLKEKKKTNLDRKKQLLNDYQVLKEAKQQLVNLNNQKEEIENNYKLSSKIEYAYNILQAYNSYTKDQKQYTDTQNKLENERKREPELRIQYENLKEEEKTVDIKYEQSVHLYTQEYDKATKDLENRKQLCKIENSISNINKSIDNSIKQLTLLNKNKESLLLKQEKGKAELETLKDVEKNRLF